MNQRLKRGICAVLFTLLVAFSAAANGYFAPCVAGHAAVGIHMQPHDPGGCGGGGGGCY